MAKTAHGGACPPGHIFDHKIGSKTYGRCIPIVKTAKATPKKKKPQPGAGRDGFRYG